jgi:hypothetical protein
MNKENTARSNEAAQQLAVLIPYLPIDALVDLVMIGNEPCHTALAQSNPVKAPVSAALAEMGDEKAILQLLCNPKSEIAAFSYIRMIERFNTSEPLLGAIEIRENLEDKKDSDLIDQALIALLWAAEGDVRKSYISAFIRFDCITPKLIAVALLNSAMAVVADVLSALTGEFPNAVIEIISKSDGVAFRNLLRRSGFPVEIITECEAAFLRATAKPSGSFAVAA